MKVWVLKGIGRACIGSVVVSVWKFKVVETLVEVCVIGGVQ